MAELDVASSLALLALQRGYVKPVILEGKEFEVKGGRHPVVDMLQPNSFVCNDCNLDEKNVWIVTGPNMGGKSSVCFSPQVEFFFLEILKDASRRKLARIKAAIA